MENRRAAAQVISFGSRREPKEMTWAAAVGFLADQEQRNPLRACRHDVQPRIAPRKAAVCAWEGENSCNKPWIGDRRFTVY